MLNLKSKNLINESSFASLSTTKAIVLQALILVVTAGYSIYHMFFDKTVIGVMAVCAVGFSALSIYSIYRKQVNAFFFVGLFVSEFACLIGTSYFFGLRGLILVFPIMGAAFYVFKHRYALIASLLLVLPSLIAALNVLEPVMIVRLAIAQLMTLAFLSAFSFMVERQYQKLERDANYDHLTGLMNRQGFSRWLNAEIKQAKKTDSSIALFLMNLDGFKTINDNFGHAVGDELLQAFSSRVKSTLRSRSIIKKRDDHNCFARLSGDEFVLAIANVGALDSIVSISSRIIDNVTEPFNISSSELRISISVGLTTAIEANYSYSRMLSQASFAMYEAKKAGKNGYRYYDDDIARKKLQRKNVENLLRESLDTDGFDLVFQPIYSCLDNRMKGAEALLRSEILAAQGFYPDVFIPVAEEVGLIREIDLWVIEAVLKRISSLDDTEEHRRLIYSINISALELQNQMFPSKLRELIGKYDVDVKRIQLEITETSLIALDEKCMRILKQISEMGVMLALDDFGMGYTAFNQLRSYPVNTLKIDRSFIMDLDVNAEQAMDMVRLIISLADLYNLKVTAEGVETVRQANFLKTTGCDYIQGYLYSRPIPWLDFKSLPMDASEPCKVTSIASAKKNKPM